MCPLALLSLRLLFLFFSFSFARDLSAEKHSGAPRDTRVDAPSSFILGLRTCVQVRACQRTVVVDDGDDEDDDVARRARAFQKGLSGREIARRGRRPRRSSHPLFGWREPPPRERCWTVRASNVPPRARLVSRRPLLLLLAPSPDDSALAARVHICTRVFVSFSVLAVAPFLIYPSLSVPPPSRFISPHATDALYLSLSFSLSSIKYTNMFVYTERRVTTMTRRRTDGERARARCPLSLCLNSRARVCTRLARPDVRDVTARRRYIASLSLARSLSVSTFASSSVPSFLLSSVDRRREAELAPRDRGP